MKRTPEYRDFMADQLEQTDVRASINRLLAWEEERTDDEQSDQFNQFKEETLQKLEELEEAMGQFQAIHERLADGYFEAAYGELRSKIHSLESQIFRFKVASVGALNARRYCTEFIDHSEVNGLDSFLESVPLFWVPRKEEIARLLGTAVIAHKQRIENGEIPKNTPVSIVDVGGGNGFLGKLIMEIARLNKIPIEYTVVDPDTASIAPAASAYRKDTNMSFKQMTTHEYVAEQYADKPEILACIRERDAVIDTWKELFVIYGRLREVEFENITAEEFKQFAVICEKDLGIPLSSELIRAARENFADFDKDTLYNQFDTYSNEDSLRGRFFAAMQAAIAEITEKLEKLLIDTPSSVDLVINSWMTPGIDYTLDIRALNGMSVAYMLETLGASGCQEHASYSTNVLMPGEVNSYTPGSLYRINGGWVSQSISEVKRKVGILPAGEVNAIFLNSVLIQSKAGQSSCLCYDPRRAGIKTGKPYRWEKDMKQMFGSLCPVRRYDRGDNDYNRFFNNVAWDMPEIPEIDEKRMRA